MYSLACSLLLLLLIISPFIVHGPRLHVDGTVSCVYYVWTNKLHAIGYGLQAIFIGYRL